MRIIKNLDDSRTKYGDTNTIFRLNLLNNEELIDTTNKTLRLNIANESGLVLSKEVKTDFTGYIELDFSDPDLQKLTPDHYLLEYEYTLPDGDVAKYPTTGGLAFTITSNLKETKGSLVTNITFDEVLTAVDEKIAVYLATVKKGDKGDTGDIGERGNDGIDGKDSDVMLSNDNVFTGKNKFTQGIKATNPIPFHDFLEVINNGTKYNGMWTIGGANLLNAPVNTDSQYGVVEVLRSEDGRGIIFYYANSPWGTGNFYTFIDNNGINGWKEIPENSKVVHNTGNETVAGDKTFTGSNTFTKIISGSIDGHANTADNATHAESATTANDPNAVHNTGDETIAGNKVLSGKTTIASKEMTDSGWLDIPLDSGVTAAYAKYRILFGVVYIHVQQISGKAAFAPYFTLPDGIRPPDMIYQTWYSGGKFGNNQLQPDGQFMCASGGSDASTQVSFYTQYPI